MSVRGITTEIGSPPAPRRSLNQPLHGTARYALAFALTGLTLLARVTLGAHFDGPTMIVLTIPIVLTAYWGGLGPGLLATILSMLGSAYYLLAPIGELKVESTTNRLQEGVLLFAGALISGVCHLLHVSRTRAENMVEAMREVRRELDTVTKNNGDLRLALDEHAIVAVTDQKGLITFVNDKFCDISQYSRPELLGQDHRIINSGYHPPEFIRELWRTIASGSVWHGEIRNRAKDGSIYWVDTTVVPFLNEAGKPTQYIAIRADITARKRIEEALRDNEERYRTLANSIPQLAWIAQPDGYIHWYNDRWYEYTGTIPEDMEGWGWQSVHDPEQLPHVMRGWTDAIKLGRKFEMEFPLRGADGAFRIFLTRVHPVKDADGHVLQWFGTNTDVNELKRAEEKVVQLNVSLERRVRERTAEVEASHKELESFSYSVSHDLRAPLRAMNGFAQMALEECGPDISPEAAHYLQRIRNGGKQMGQLIDDLLAFSRLSRQPVKRNDINTFQLVNGLLEETMQLETGRSINFHCEHLLACHGDAVLLKQVWINLISNAVKYSRNKEKSEIQIGSVDRGAEIEYWIRDNGTGFDMQYAHKLFEVFQRLHRSDEFEGTGVGLAIVQRIIHRHGGRVWAEAQPGLGATFRFTLPTVFGHD